MHTSKGRNRIFDNPLSKKTSNQISMCYIILCYCEFIFRVVFGELSPGAAVVGGVLAQEIIKAVSHKDAPIRNHFFFNGATDFNGVVEAIGFWTDFVTIFPSFFS